MTLEVLAPGVLTSVQDAGRIRARAQGIGISGAADAYSRTIANLLVGNRPDAAVLEFTLSGPMLRLRRDAIIAICGAPIDAHCDGFALPGWRPIVLRSGSTLVFGGCRPGARVVLAIDGGIDVPVVLGSRSTDLRGGFGGHEGRAIRNGDQLPLGNPLLLAGASQRPSIARWWINPEPDLDFADSVWVRFLRGRDATSPTGTLQEREFVVDPASNRQGLRLRSDPLQPDDARDRISEPVVPGTIQLPPDGQPLVLLADAQTVGGYPRIGHVIAADLPRLAQRRAGQRVRFIPVDALEAAQANADQRARVGRIAIAISSRRRLDPMGGSRRRGD